MNGNPTTLLNALLSLTDDADAIRFEEENGHTFIVLDRLRISLSFTSQAALDKLATVAAQAAADSRARNLREVA